MQALLAVELHDPLDSPLAACLEHPGHLRGVLAPGPQVAEELAVVAAGGARGWLWGGLHGR